MSTERELLEKAFFAKFPAFNGDLTPGDTAIKRSWFEIFEVGWQAATAQSAAAVPSERRALHDGQPPSEASAAAHSAESVCPNCSGCGTETAMTSHLGPDDYEYEDQCSHCGGSGELSDAYLGVVKLLEQKDKECMRAYGDLWAASHARKDMAGWRYRVSGGPWVYTENGSDIPTRERGCEWQTLYPPLSYNSIARGIEREALSPKGEEPGPAGTRPEEAAKSSTITEVVLPELPEGEDMAFDRKSGRVLKRYTRAQMEDFAREAIALNRCEDAQDLLALRRVAAGHEAEAMSGQTLIERLRYIRGRAVEYVEWRKAGFPMTDERDTYSDDLYSAAVRAEAMVPLLDEVLAALSHPDMALKDAERYRQIRRGQRWSVYDGIGDVLRADALDSAIDESIATARHEQLVHSCCDALACDAAASGGWCAHCGCGNDGLGYAHAPLCQRQALAELLDHCAKQGWWLESHAVKAMDRAREALAAAPSPAPAPHATQEAMQALQVAQEWINHAPHGDNCFVSDHYEGDPGNQCRCGKDSLLAHLELVLEADASQEATRQHERDAALLRAREAMLLARGRNLQLDEVLAALSHPAVPLRLEACDAAASEPELSEDDVGALAYRGNTVSYMYDRAKAYGDEIMRTWFAIKDAGLHPGRTDERLSDCVKRILAAAPSPAPAPEPATSDKWEGAEEWMPLAWQLCANECGEESCAELVWEGGPIPEPWGDRWLKYEDQAKEMIAMVRKHVPSIAGLPTDNQRTNP